MFLRSVPKRPARFLSKLWPVSFSLPIGHKPLRFLTLRERVRRHQHGQPTINYGKRTPSDGLMRWCAAKEAAAARLAEVTSKTVARS